MLIQIKNGCGQSGHGTLKLAVFSMLFFFACCCKFRKGKSWFNDFWVGLVKDGIGLLVHETLKSAVKNEYMNWADYLNADSGTIVSG